MTRKLPVRPEDLQSEAPSPESLAKLANQLRVDDEALAELERDLDRAAAPGAEPTWPPVLEEPRRRVDTRYADPATSHRPIAGPVLVAAKRSFRLVFQPFINEVLRRQVEFNEAILASLANIYEQVRVNARTQALWRADIEERLARLERPPPDAESRPKRRGRPTRRGD